MSKFAVVKFHIVHELLRGAHWIKNLYIFVESDVFLFVRVHSCEEHLDAFSQRPYKILPQEPELHVKVMLRAIIASLSLVLSE